MIYPSLSRQPLLLRDIRGMNRLYQLIEAEDGLFFYCVGSCLSGLPDAAALIDPGKPLPALRKHDFFLPFCDVRSASLSGNLDDRVRGVGFGASAYAANFACRLRLQTQKKRYHFGLLFPETDPTPLLELLSRHLSVTLPKKPSPLPQPDCARSERLFSLLMYFYIAAFLVCIAWVFFGSFFPGWLYALCALFSLSVFPVLFVLCLRYPGELTLLGFNRWQPHRHSLILPLLLSCFPALFRCRFTFYHYPRLFLFVGIFTAVLCMLYLLRCRGARIGVALVLMAGFLYGFGLIAQGNYLFDPGTPLAQQVTVDELYPSGLLHPAPIAKAHSATGECLYLPVSESLFSDLEPGDCLNVTYSSGALGIPYALETESGRP